MAMSLKSYSCYELCYRMKDASLTIDSFYYLSYRRRLLAKLANLLKLEFFELTDALSKSFSLLLYLYVYLNL
jgi:hypothetical protein